MNADFGYFVQSGGGMRKRISELRGLEVVGRKRVEASFLMVAARGSKNVIVKHS